MTTTPATKRGLKSTSRIDSDNKPPRLQKALAAAGLGSRRSCEQLILDGRVEVDRQVVTELGARVDPYSQEIRVDGELLRLQNRVCYLVNKPPGFVSTNRDPDGRPRVVDLVPGGDSMFTIGRLDRFSEGLILVTNDGELANRLAHPRYGVHKTYRVVVIGHPDRKTLAKLQQGVRLAEGVVRAIDLKVKSRGPQSTTLQMELAEGKNREIRRMLAKFGHRVQSLKRIAVGPLRLKDVPPGAYRELTQQELNQLWKATQPPQHR